MTLSDWIEREGVSLSEFGSRIGRTAEAVRRYCNGDRIPDRKTMPLIVRHTGGAVTPTDFFPMPAEAEPEQAAA